MSSSGAPSAKRKASFLAFFLVWAEFKGWAVPDIHIRACHWLEHRGDLAVLRCFRGFGKSTILACYNAWRYWDDPTYRILHQGDQDKTAYKTSRDTKSVLARHPWTSEWFANGNKGEAAFWWCPGADDERNPSMQAAGILSNITSSRCDEAQNDDVEVPKNITNPESREKMRARLGEQIHIMVPGAWRLFIGTPHTHDSIYDEQEKLGADCLTIKMFDREHRIELANKKSYPVPFTPALVFFGIGETCRVLVEGVDYTMQAGKMVFASPPGGLVDLYDGSAWPERFTTDEMIKRRRACRTVNEWDSQYQLHSKPVGETRLDPDRLKVYDVEPTIRTHNAQPVMYLGKARIVSATAHWDPAGNKLNSDTSAFCLVLQDETGRPYWHRAIALEGEVAELNDDGKVVGGQVMQICDLVKELAIPRVTIETNGVGTHAPGLLRGALKSRRIRCGVADQHTTANKARKILGAFDSPLSSGYLWAHVSVLEAVEQQMRSWNPAATNQPDDFLDAGAECLIQQPERIGRGPKVGNADPHERDDWRPSAGTFEIEVDQVV
jgi:hypothetical protein